MKPKKDVKKKKNNGAGEEKYKLRWKEGKIQWIKSMPKKISYGVHFQG